MSRYQNLILKFEELDQDWSEGRIDDATAIGRERELEREWDEYWKEEDAR